MLKLFKSEWLNEEAKKGNIELITDVGYIRKVMNHQLVDVEINSVKSWKNKFRNHLKKEGFIYIYAIDAYASPKINYEWSRKKWDKTRSKLYAI